MAVVKSNSCEIFLASLFILPFQATLRTNLIRLLESVPPGQVRPLHAHADLKETNMIDLIVAAAYIIVGLHYLHQAVSSK